MDLDETKLNSLLGTMVNELGAAANAALVLVGDKLGLYRALAGEASTSAALADKTNTHERYVREWLSAQAASGFVSYDADAETFTLSPEQAAVFADTESSVNMTGGFYSLAAVFADEPKLTQAFKTGKGVGWGEHCNCFFCGVERFFRPGYKAHLVRRARAATRHASLNQEVGAALGAQAGEKRLAEIIRAAGFSRFRRAAETPFNMVLEARP